MSLPLVFDIRRFSIHDGPGIRTTVFLKGCPLRCRWCHNPEGLAPSATIYRRRERCLGCGACAEACPSGLLPMRDADAAGSGAASDPAACADVAACAACLGKGEAPCAAACPSGALQQVGRRYEASAIMAEALKDRSYYEESGGGVTFSGGEPLFHPDYLFALLDACRDAGIHTALETSAAVPTATFLGAARKADLLLVDLKHIDSRRHRELTGMPNEDILANIAALAELQAKGRGADGTNGAGDTGDSDEADGRRPVADAWLRLPLVPGLNDGPADLEAAADFAAATVPGWPVQLLPYHDAARGKYALAGLPFLLPGIAPPGAEAMEAAAAHFRARGLDVKIGGQVR
jgi:pyruvate formate lyase activating enzyme